MIGEMLAVGIPVYMDDFRNKFGSSNLLSEIENFKCINYGGCGIVASAIAKVLEEYGIECGIRVVDYHNDESSLVPLEQAKNNLAMNRINEWDKQGVDMNHLVVHVDGVDIDSRGEYQRDYATHPGLLTADEVFEVAVEHDEGWNQSFNRDDKWLLYYAARHATIETLKEVLPAHEKSKTITIH